jgi:hypothetical protein
LEQLAYDPFRDRLLYTDLVPGGGIRSVDARGGATSIAPGRTRPLRIAAPGDGILNLWYTPSNPFRYLDASDTAHDLLNEAETGPQIFPLGAVAETKNLLATTLIAWSAS